MPRETQPPVPYVDDRDDRPLDAAELLEEWHDWQRAQAKLERRAGGATATSSSRAQEIALT